MRLTDFVTVAVTAADTGSDFSCGIPPLDAYFQKHALPNHARGVGRTYVLRSPATSTGPSVIGFYTVSMAQLMRADLPAPAQKGLPAYPLPVALVGRLAVDHRVQGGGYGKVLLGDALQRVLQAAHQVACLGVIVDAKDARAEGFYSRHGFTALAAVGAFPRRMFLPLSMLQDAPK